MNSDLLYSLGLEITDFQTSAKAADEQAKAIKRSLGGFKDVLMGGGVGAVVIGFFRDVIAHAKRSKDGFDQNHDAVKRFSGGLSEAKGAVLSWGAAFLGVLNRAGENLVDIANYIRLGSEEFERRAASDREAAAAEQRSAAMREKYGERYKALHREIAQIQQERDAQQLKSLTVQERANHLLNQYYESVKAAANTQATDDESKLRKRELEAEAAKNYVKVLESQADLKAEMAKQDEAAAAASQKALAEEEKKARTIADIRQKIADASRSQLETSEQITALQGEEAQLQSQLVTHEEGTAGWIEKQNRLLEVQTLLRDKVTKAAEDTKTLEEKKAKAIEMSEKARADIYWQQSNGGISGEALLNASEETLKEIQRRNNQSKLTLPYQYSFGGLDFRELRIENENNRIDRELAFRRDFLRSVRVGGEAGARRNFDGEPTAFEEVLARLTNQWEKLDETNSLLNDIRRDTRDNGGILAGGFNRLGGRGS